MIDNKENPIFVKIADALKAQISNQGYAPGMLLPKEVDLAESFHVSRSTLRNAMAVLEKDGWIIRKKRYGTIVAPDAMRRKYRKIDLGFFARSSLTDYQEYINLFNADLHFGYTLRRAVKRGYFIRLFPWGENATYDLEEVLLRKGVDAFVVSSPAYLRDVMEHLRLRRIPHMGLETHIAKPGVNSMILDNEGAVATIMGELHRQGHRKVGFHGGLLKCAEVDSSARRVMAAFLKSAANYGMSIRESYLQCVGAEEYNNREVDYREMAWQMLRGDDRPTAVLAVNHFEAEATIEVARKIGLRVPEDLSVAVAITYPDRPRMNLTGMYYDLDEYADMVLDELVLNLRNAAYRGGVHLLRGRFHEGATLGPVPEG